MIISFCGHSSFQRNKEYENKILAIFDNIVGDKPVDMFLGGYGGFDSFAYDCCKKYKEKHPNVNLVFVTPYFTIEYQKNRLNYLNSRYDSIIYPEIENVPPKFAIVYRNRYMVEKADYVIACVSRCYGGAYTAYKYAKSKGKEIFNLVELKE